MNAVIAILSFFLLFLALFVLYFVEHHNARAVLFVSLFTLGVVGLVLSVAVSADYRNGTFHVATFEILELKQYSAWALPSAHLLLTALVATFFIGLLAIIFEIVVVITNQKPLKTRLVPVPKNYRLHPSYISKIYITVLIPAHNEALSLPHTLTSLAAQTRPPDKIIVVADNCTDETASIAREMGYEVFETVGNTLRKAGALNQVLSKILPDLGPQDVILVMDADSQINSSFLETGAEYFRNFPVLDAIGGVFYGEDGHGLLGQFQRNEYARYSDQIKRRGGRVFVLTGTASLFRSDALLSVARSRGIYIPGEHGQVYDTAALTEDNELTIALKSIGCPMISPDHCQAVSYTHLTLPTIYSV